MEKACNGKSGFICILGLSDDDRVEHGSLKNMSVHRIFAVGTQIDEEQFGSQLLHAQP